MAYTKVVVADGIRIVDITPPGDPVVEVTQSGQGQIQAEATLPTVDADGTELSGLGEIHYGLLEGEENPFVGVEAGNLMKHAEDNGGKSMLIYLQDSDAGKKKATRFSGLEMGKKYWIAATIKDAVTQL